MHTEQLLDNYYQVCNDLVNRFLNLLFEGNFVDRDWVGGEVAGVLSFCDYFASMDDIQHFFEYGMEPDEWFTYYDWCMDNHMEGKPLPLNMKNWLLAERSKFNKK